MGSPGPIGYVEKNNREENPMLRYSALLFDLDDTLLDFRTAEATALADLFDSLGAELTPAIHHRYHELNAAMWKDLEKGLIGREELCDSRFSLLFAELGREIDGPAAERIFRQSLDQDATLIPGALPLLEQLAPQCEIHLVTNGTASTQRKRVALSGLDRFLGKLFISEEIGHPKPEQAFFTAVFDGLPGLAAGDMLVIGDSLSSDIRGAHNAGIDSCWFNPRGMERPAFPAPTYEIRNLGGLLELL